MQIDFHHAVTYVAARLAGIDKGDAEILAYAAQYVDDATSEGTVHFSNNAMYHRVASAHGMTDPSNLKRSIKNHMVWLPFHFLPGNDGLAHDQDVEGGFINKIVCKTNSLVAQEMVTRAIEEKDKPYGLHRFGVTMHVYADTWAHYDFAGVIHDINEVEDAEEVGDTKVFSKGLGNWWRDFLDDTIPPLGHGRANVFPDMPFLKWKYENYQKQTIVHDNLETFCDAANHLCMAMERYKAGDPNYSANGIGAEDKEKIKNLFKNTLEKDGEKRHEVWLKKIEQGHFSFGAEKLSYAGKGKNSWKKQALGSNFDDTVHAYSPDFLDSNWKLFHDGVLAHRFYVLHELLPKYGICAA